MCGISERYSSKFNTKNNNGLLRTRKGIVGQGSYEQEILSMKTIGVF